MNKSGVLGTRAESAVVAVLQRFWPDVERRRQRGAADAGDIAGVPRVVWEVKGGKAAKTASDNQIAAWLEETEIERQNAEAEVGVLVVQRAGIGYPNAGRWWAIMANVELARDLGQIPAPARSVRLYLADACDVLLGWGY